MSLCSAADIKALNQTKEYTLMATCLLEALLKDQRLLGNTKTLWLFLYTRSRFSDNLSVTISYHELALELGFSPRAIERYIKALVNAGYLDIQHNIDRDKGQTANTYLVRVPKLYVALAEGRKDRKTYLAKQDPDAPKFPSLLTRKEEPPPAKIVIAPHDQAVVPFINNIKENNNNNRADLKNPLSLLDLPPVVVFSQKGCFKKNKENPMPKHTRITEVPVTSLLEDILQPIKNKIDVLKKRCDDAKHSWVSEKDPEKAVEKYFDFQEAYNQLVSEDYFCQQEEKRLKGLVEKEQQAISDANEDIKRKAREDHRTFTNFMATRYRKMLSDLGYDDQAQHDLFDEITFEASYGSLANDLNGHPNSLERAMNIAMKLVREGRWQTPKGWKKP